MTNLKGLILDALDDGNPHKASEIKQLIKSKYDNNFTEGQYAGCFRDLYSDGFIDKLSRGVYVKNSGIITSIRNDTNPLIKVVISSHDYIRKSIQGINIFELENKDLEILKQIKDILNELNSIAENIKNNE